MLRNLDRSLSAAQLGITLASLGLGWIGEPVFAALLRPVMQWLQIESPAVQQSLAPEAWAEVQRITEEYDRRQQEWAKKPCDVCGEATLEHNVTTPEPYDRVNLIAGTKGIFRDYPPRIFVDGNAKHEFGPIDPYKAKYEHPFWTRMGQIARKLGGHGGMDFIQAYRLIQCIQEGIVPDMDAYDAAAWCAPAPLSEMSVAKGSAPIPFPDFTRGRWKQRS